MLRRSHPKGLANQFITCALRPTVLFAPKSCIDKAHRVQYNVHMTEIRFIWDSAKAAENQRKHGVSFEEARSIFFDENARLKHDPDHSSEEDRFLLLGVSYAFRVLLVVHCYREENEVVRLISARKATKSERKQYESFMR